MTTNFHTPISNGASNDKATWNTPLAALDAAISAVSGAGGTFTLANGGTSNTTLDVDSTSGFVVGADVIYIYGGESIEYNSIANISGTTITLTNTPSGAIADNAVIAQVTPDVAAASDSLPYGGTVSAPPLHTVLNWAGQSYYNIEAFGAVSGGDATANTTAIAAAIAAATGGNGAVFVPPGLYTINGAVTLNNGDVLVGTGWNRSVINLSGASARINFDDRCVISDLRVDGDDTSGQIGLAGVVTASQWVLQRLRVRECDIGIDLSDATAATISDCQVDENNVGLKFSGRNGSATVAANIINVENCRFFDNANEGVLVDASGLGTNKVRLQGCTIEGATTYGIRLATGSNQFTVRDCWIEGLTNGITVAGSSTLLTIENNRFTLGTSASAVGIDFTGGTHATTEIRRNYFDVAAGGTSTDAISINAANNYILLAGNHYASSTVVSDAGNYNAKRLVDGSTAQTKLGGVAGLSRGTVYVAQNSSGTVTFGSADTTVAVTFATAEPDTDYHIAVGNITWNAYVKVNSKTTTGFKIAVSAARGSGSETVYWTLFRDA